MECIKNVFHLTFLDDITIAAKFEVHQSCRTCRDLF